MLERGKNKKDIKKGREFLLPQFYYLRITLD
jgi:hypothetical protein